MKEKAVEYKGGKCIICNYDKCTAALEFHHRDPSQKEIKLGSGRTKNWEKMKQELDKCDLLCCRCHREIHDAWRQEKREKDRLKFSVGKRTTRSWTSAPCVVCSKIVEIDSTKLKTRKQVFCSKKCNSRFQERITWPSNIELKTMVETTSLLSVAKKLGVSDKAVKKRYISKCLM